jgi:hypothetical protein
MSASAAYLTLDSYVKVACPVCDNTDISVDWAGGTYATQHANFGTQTSESSLHSDLEVVHAEPADGCGSITNGGGLAGKAVLIQGGWPDQDWSCPSHQKASNAQDVGAAVVIIYSNADEMVDPIVTVDDDTTCVVDGNCFSSHASAGSSDYPNGYDCTFTASAAGVLRSESFSVEPSANACTANEYDHLTVGGTRYCGTSSPDGVSVAAGESFVWKTNVSRQMLAQIVGQLRPYFEVVDYPT